jgi:hypothetical protein
MVCLASHHFVVYDPWTSSTLLSCYLSQPRQPEGKETCLLLLRRDCRNTLRPQTRVVRFLHGLVRRMQIPSFTIVSCNDSLSPLSCVCMYVLDIGRYHLRPLCVNILVFIKRTLLLLLAITISKINFQNTYFLLLFGCALLYSVFCFTSLHFPSFHIHIVHFASIHPYHRSTRPIACPAFPIHLDPLSARNGTCTGFLSSITQAYPFQHTSL